MTEPIPLLDRVIGRVAGLLLLWGGKRAKRRGDMHEFNHIRAAVDAGNSNHPGSCRIPEIRSAIDG